MSCIIQLPKNLETLVSEEDFARVREFPWFLDTSTGYVVRNRNAGSRYLHVFIAGKASTGMYVDHANRNRLDNTRENLRHVTPTQNATNSSPRRVQKTSLYKGVQKTRSGNWVTRIQTGDKNLHLGTFAYLNFKAVKL